jgi:hypothetical protein
VLRHVLEQIKEPVQVLQDQAQLTRDERAHPVEAEKRAEAAAHLAAERVEAAEREAKERVAAVRREEAERFENLRRSALQLLEENRELHREKEALRVEQNKLHESLKAMTREKLDFQMLAKEYGDRVTDIPMPEVMEKLGYEGARHGESLVYRGDQGQLAMIIEQQKAYGHQRELLCKNSIDLVLHMKRENEGIEEFTHNYALEWLRGEFGEKRAVGAYVVNREHFVLDYFERERGERERARSLVHERSDDPWRGPQGRAEDHERSRRDHGSDDRGVEAAASAVGRDGGRVMSPYRSETTSVPAAESRSLRLLFEGRVVNPSSTVLG